MEETEKMTQVREHPLPFMAGSFAPGESQQYIDSIEDEEMKAIAIGERYYYAGEGKKCVDLAKTLLNSNRLAVKISAALMFTFGNICAGNPADATKMFLKLKGEYADKITGKAPGSDAEKNYGAFLKNLATVLLHLENTPFMEMDMPKLPPGIRLIAFYALAHNHYLAGEYGQAAGVAETALSCCDARYPVGEIYLHIIACVAYMNMNENKRAVAHFKEAWEIAKPEGFIEPFSEHHGLLHGMIEIHLRKMDPESYERIVRQVYVFAKAWRQVHNPIAGGNITDELTTTEFTVAMLASKGWKNEKIADHLGVSVSTIKTHIYSIYKKLHITSRKDLPRFMLK